ncbi:tyrosinase family protein [Cellulophaga sp. L1A9]|uniref:tyrosinase family protein n=1 Tax=Cellulophaga sp. L1A9 TaxID=2686362 RepID=UPI00131B819C|nr:tyrosinase family protein [Cellulophaga sp. L1A9]
MGVRKNAKHLTATEQENFVRACVLMKADIVNPGAPVSQRYSIWDENVALHRMIQSGVEPGGNTVNFGHGGTGSYSFLSWHREFLFRFESQLQSYVSGVMLPYWDWTDPSPIMTDTFLGTSGTGANNVIETGYFAVTRPGSGVNSTPLPSWWPASLNGWILPQAFPTLWQGGLRRSVGNVSSLPTVNAIAACLSINNYHNFQSGMETGAGLPSGNAQMHNGMHGFIGGSSAALGGHMSNATASPFDPFFYLHHCNIDRYWAMWQMDGHANEYPTMGGANFHNSNDLMYPWVGATPGYSTIDTISNNIPMPDFSATPERRNVDTLDFRSEYNYTYDCMPIIGIGLDKTGSMNGMTPDPMVTTAPDVTKWEAAKRGVSLFLQDCETVQESATTYIHAGIQTFRSVGANVFDTIFTGPGFGLVKDGTSFSHSSFDSLIASHSPGGGTPLADALIQANNTLVNAPFGNLPNDEQRYLAMLTDGKRTSGSLFTTIANGSLSPTTIFGLGFGTGVDVDYTTIATMVAKGTALSTTQIFHGENAGTIDKFYTSALARAIGYTSIFDPLLEFFEGEHAHIHFNATSAEDNFLITTQGYDFNDSNWDYRLKGPDGTIHYGGLTKQDHSGSSNCTDCCPLPHVNFKRSKGRLSMVIQRNNASRKCWVGQWELLISYRAKDHSVMLMPTLGELLFPVSGGPIRGNQYQNLLVRQNARIPTRKIFSKASNGLDSRAPLTNAERGEGCNILINIYAKTRLRLDVSGNESIVKTGNTLKLKLSFDSPNGKVSSLIGFSRMISPSIDFDKLISPKEADKIMKKNESSKKPSKDYDLAILLAKRLQEQQEGRIVNDKELQIKVDNGSTLCITGLETKFKGSYHLGILVNGNYEPNYDDLTDGCCGSAKGKPEAFSRLINYSFGVV